PERRQPSALLLHERLPERGQRVGLTGDRLLQEAEPGRVLLRLRWWRRLDRHHLGCDHAARRLVLSIPHHLAHTRTAPALDHGRNEIEIDTARRRDRLIGERLALRYELERHLAKGQPGGQRDADAEGERLAGAERRHE